MRAVEIESARGGGGGGGLMRQLLGLATLGGKGLGGKESRVAERLGKGKGGKRYEVWIGFIVDAAFAWGEADFKG